MHTLAPLGQSDRANYLSYFIKPNIPLCATMYFKISEFTACLVPFEIAFDLNKCYFVHSPVPGSPERRYG